MKLRTIVLGDYNKLIPFWKKNYFVNEMDSFDRFKLFLDKNPNLSLVMEENDEIIGTALGSFDGRRGYLQKVVTGKDSRRKGVGKQLVEEVLKRLQDAGARYIPINVEEDLVPFYKNCGFKKTPQIPMNKNI